MHRLILALLLLSSPLVQAVEVKDLHVVEIPVADQTRDSRAQAYRSALAEVLLRYSGRSDVLFNPAILAALDKANNYVKSYRYRKLDVQQAKEKGLEGEQLVVWVELYPNTVQQLLRDNGLPIWGQVRPSLMSWVVLEQGGTRELLGAASSHPAQAVLQAQAALRGQPLQFPLLDLQDQQAVSVSDVWGGFIDPVKQASLRYGSDVVLSGRVYSSGSQRWHGDWHLVIKEQSWDWKIQGNDLVTVIRPSVDLAVDYIASRFSQATANTSANYTLVKVWNMHTLSDYAAVLGYLQKQVSVVEVTPDTVEPEAVVFRIRSEGDWESVSKAIGLGYRLYPYQPETAEADGAPAQAMVHYRYLP